VERVILGLRKQEENQLQREKRKSEIHSRFSQTNSRRKKIRICYPVESDWFLDTRFVRYYVVKHGRYRGA
jgi:hypothetical protein